MEWPSLGSLCIFGEAGYSGFDMVIGSVQGIVPGSQYFRVVENMRKKKRKGKERDLSSPIRSHLTPIFDSYSSLVVILDSSCSTHTQVLSMSVFGVIIFTL